MIDQSLEMTRGQRFKFNVAVFVCFCFFGFAMLDVFVPDWPNKLEPIYDKSVEKLGEQLTSWGF